MFLVIDALNFTLFLKGTIVINKHEGDQFRSLSLTDKNIKIIDRSDAITQIRNLTPSLLCEFITIKVYMFFTSYNQDIED